MIDLILIFICSILISLYLLKYKRPKNYPPGPTPFPFIGNTFQIPKGNFHMVIENWSKQYGPIIGFSIFDDFFIAVNGVKHVLEALRREEFQSRPSTFTLRNQSFGKSLGIFFSSGDQWASSRKFTVKQLKAFGQNETENLITDEIAQLMDTIKDGSTVQGAGMFGISAVNIVWSMMASKRLDLNNNESRRTLKNVYYFFRGGNAAGINLVNNFPFLRFIIPGYKRALKLRMETQDFIRKTVQEHKEVLDYNNPIDLIDHYLVEIENRKSDPNSYFTEEDLITVGVEMFSAAAESTSNSVEFVLMYMILYPEVQQKVQEELDRILERSRKPALKDKAEMHYTMAVLNEVERLNSIAPITVMHYSTKDTIFGGYFIPKGAQININLHSLGNDPEYWKNPEEFMPERFLDAEGKYTKSQIFYPFGLGQRICIGEMLARNSIFLFTTTFLEKYTVSLPPGEPKPSTEALPGFTTAPKPFKIHIKSRY